MSDPLLSVENLRVEYFTRGGNVCVVDDVSFSIPAGGVMGLAGESGSGKTTIVQAILRILKAPAVITGGKVLFEGRDVLDFDDAGLRAFRWKKVSLVTQSAMNALNPVITVGEQISDVIEAHEGRSRRQGLKRAAELLELVGIEPDRVSSYAHELSGGMRQRVVIALALALKPPMILMDEPTTAPDVVVQREILRQIRALKDELGFSVLFITHDLSLMLQFCDEVGVLYSGRLAEIGPVQALARDPRHPYTRGLIGSVPEARPDGTLLKGIAGHPPDPRDPPPGCRFNPRCGQALDRCRQERPELSPLDAGRQVACHLFP